MTDAELKARFDRIDARQEALIAGCSQMNDTIEILRDAVRDLHEVLNTPPSGDYKEVLERLLGGFETMTRAVQVLGSQVARIPEQVASRVHAGVR